MKSPKAIPLSRLTAHPDNPRLMPAEEIIGQIAAAIRERGSFDVAHALIVRPLGDTYQIVSGHNRAEAARRAGLDAVPAWIRELSEDDALLMLITENAQRELRPLERGLHALKCIKKGSHKDGIEAYARAIGREAELQTVKREYWAAEVATAAQKEQRCSFSDVVKYYLHLAEIHAAPPEVWGALVERLIADTWTVQEARQHAQAANAKAKREEQARVKTVMVLDEWKAAKPIDRGDFLGAWRTIEKPTTLNRQDTTSIDWAKWSWNPVTGCQHNCPYCYARDIAERFYAEKFQPAIHIDRLGAPAHTPVPATASQDTSLKNIFTCSMADLFGKWVPKQWIEEVLGVVRENPQWNFLFLTKFPLRMAEFEYPPNAWLGTSVDLQARVANAERTMREVRASVKWLSLEPLLEPLVFEDLSAFNWVVIGGASASNQTPEWRPPQQWVYDLTAAALRAGCAVYHKTNLDELRLKAFPWVNTAQEKALPDVFRYLKVIA